MSEITEVLYMRHMECPRCGSHGFEIDLEAFVDGYTVKLTRFDGKAKLSFEPNTKAIDDEGVATCRCCDEEQPIWRFDKRTDAWQEAQWRYNHVSPEKLDEYEMETLRENAQIARAAAQGEEA